MVRPHKDWVEEELNAYLSVNPMAGRIRISINRLHTLLQPVPLMWQRNRNHSAVLFPAGHNHYDTLSPVD